MGWNHRYVLRLVTDTALTLFVLSAVGAGLWVTDEFLGWNILPDWIDKYAQLIVVLVGAGMGLAVGASLLCSLALLAESAAERSGIKDYRTPPRAWRLVGLGLVVLVVGIYTFYRIDLYRKGVETRKQRQTEEAEFERRVRVLGEALPRLVAAFPSRLVEAMQAEGLSDQDGELITFLGAIQSSTAYHPQVVVMTRAASPYRFCGYRLRVRRDSEVEEGRGKFYLEKQFYMGFPSPAEVEAVDQLFGGQPALLKNRLEGEVLNNVRPGAWGALRWNGQVAGLLLIQADFPNQFGFFHGG